MFGLFSIFFCYKQLLQCYFLGSYWIRECVYICILDIAKVPSIEISLSDSSADKADFCTFAIRVGYRAFLSNHCISSYNKNWYISIDLICILSSGKYLFICFRAICTFFMSIDPLPIFSWWLVFFLILTCTKPV